MRQFGDAFWFGLGRILSAQISIAIAGTLIYRLLRAWTEHFRPFSQSSPTTLPAFDVWFQDALQNNFGDSITRNQPVSEVIAQYTSASLELLIPALVIGVILGTLIGVFLGLMRRNLLDQLLQPILILAVALPVFWVGLVGIHQFAVERDTFPVAGRCDVVLGTDECLGQAEHLALPLLTLSLYTTAAIALYIRRSVLEVGRRAEKSALFGFVSLPDLAITPMLSNLWGMLLVVETLFAWPGLGRQWIAAIIQGDTFLIIGLLFSVTLWTTVIYIVFGLLFAVGGGVIAIASKTKFIPLSISAQPYPASVANIDTLPEGLEARPWPLFSGIFTGLAALLLIFMLGVAVSADNINTSRGIDAMAVNPTSRFIPAGENDDHPLGTDEFGRDALARLVIGMQNSLMIAGIGAVIAFVIALVIGLFAGLPWGDFGSFINFFVDAIQHGFIVLPPLFLLIAAILVQHDSSPAGIAYIMGLIGWANILPVSRATFRNWRERIRQKSFRFGEFLLEFFNLVIYSLALNTAAFLLLEGAMTFLGVGVMPPDASLGSLLSSGQMYLNQASHLIYPPGIVLFALVACLLLIAERSREVFRVDAPIAKVVVGSRYRASATDDNPPYTEMGVGVMASHTLFDDHHTSQHDTQSDSDSRADDSNYQGGDSDGGSWWSFDSSSDSGDSYSDSGDSSSFD